MKYFKSFSENLKTMGEDDFEGMALELFRLQAASNPVYKAYVRARGIHPAGVRTVEEIPFLPLSFFKTQSVYCGEIMDRGKFYSSSGTTGAINSKHYYWSEEFYLQHAKRIFESYYGELKDYHLLALLPSYLERKGSSLIGMADFFIRETRSPFSGFYLYNHVDLARKLVELKDKSDRRVILLGVTFALLDLVESGLELPRMDNLIVMETGGMKGRRRELVREEVHAVLGSAFGLSKIHSEYGMTEMMSQAYSHGGGKYKLPDCMRVLIRDTHDPFSFQDNKVGGINVIDLANFHSCAFLETQDLGKWDEEGMLEVVGRFDNSDLRGCNLMVQ